uniref:hypothetical protein n=1 Tax=Pasteurellaceae TaxID=712 RepID=UPI0015E8444D|nr:MULTISPECIES: hypothetical protein [Pasteurellaceae]
MSFEEAELSDSVKREIIEEFEKAFFPYFQDKKERYNTLWIQILIKYTLKPLIPML